MLTLHWCFQINVKESKREEGLKETVEIQNLFLPIFLLATRENKSGR